MIRIFAIAGCVALATPALAQQAPYPDRPLPPGQRQVPPDTPPAQTAPPAAADIARIVVAEFPAHDTDPSGLLDTAEFSHWIRALRAAAPGQPAMAEADLQAWTLAAFTQADTDRNKGVDPAEMTAFLTAAA